MNKKTLTVLSVLVIVLFIAYIIYDVIKPAEEINNVNSPTIPEMADAWKISSELAITEGALKTVSVSPSGTVYVGGDSFLSSYDNNLKLKWNIKTPVPLTALSSYGDTIFASTIDQILIIDKDGKILNEWGPFEDSCIITSITSNFKYVAIADAGNKMVFILDKGGEVKKMIGQNDKQFVIPSPYFDIALDKENDLFTANTGHHRIETRTIDGVVKTSFGEPGSAPERFCGCCSPPHFALIPEGFVTSEKGINRIKILNKKGEFVEFVNSKNSFVKSVPLDVASADGITIYAANPVDSKLYVFNRK